MKAFKFYVAADDNDGAFVYESCPVLNEDNHHWLPVDSSAFAFVPEKVFKSLGISIDKVLDHPCEIMIIVPGQQCTVNSNQPK